MPDIRCGRIQGIQPDSSEEDLSWCFLHQCTVEELAGDAPYLAILLLVPEGEEDAAPYLAILLLVQEREEDGAPYLAVLLLVQEIEEDGAPYSYLTVLLLVQEREEDGAPYLAILLLVQEREEDARQAGVAVGHDPLHAVGVLDAQARACRHDVTHLTWEILPRRDHIVEQKCDTDPPGFELFGRIRILIKTSFYAEICLKRYGKS